MIVPRDQWDFDVRCEWGRSGIELLSSTSDALVIVDVMSFSTAVSVAVARGAVVYPCRELNESNEALARTLDAELAVSRSVTGYSLSPASLLTIPAGTKLVLPSPNGSSLSLATGATPTYAGCLRNARAVAQAASGHGPRIGVIPCGERWKDGEDGLRPALEDFIGAGAIIGNLTGSRSPEAMAAVAVFRSLRRGLPDALTDCFSGRELAEMGFGRDIELIAALDTDEIAPRLVDGAFACRS